MPAHYVLDHNFPALAVDVNWPPALQLVTLRQYDPQLTNVDDWRLIEELSARGDVAGLVTIDGRMLNLPKEMVALSRSKLTLVVTEKAGNNGLRATGLLLVHMLHVARLPDPVPRIVVLDPGRLEPQSVDRHINRLAQQRNLTPREMLRDAEQEMRRLRELQ